MPLDTTLILVALIIMFASAIKITFGIGFALIGTPLLLLIMEPDRVVGFIAPLILLQDCDYPKPNVALCAVASCRAACRRG